MLKCPHDAEETANDVFVRIWQLRSNWEAQRGTFMLFFNVVCRSVMATAYKKQLRDARKRIGDLLSESEVESDRIVATPDTFHVDAGDALIYAEQMIMIENALCQMPSAEQRLAFILRHVEGYTYEKIGRIIKQSKAVAQKRVRKATNHLRAYLIEISLKGSESNAESG